VGVEPLPVVLVPGLDCPARVTPSSSRRC